MTELFAEVTKPLSTPGSSGFYKSWRLASVDGTCLDIADTPANETYYGRPGTATPIKSAYTQARVLGLADAARMR